MSLTVIKRATASEEIRRINPSELLYCVLTTNSKQAMQPYNQPGTSI